jgi:hypothetical protein
MNKGNKLLSFLALVFAAALLFGGVPASADENLGAAESLAHARKALEQELSSLAATGFAGIAHSEVEGEIIVFVEDEQARGRVPHSFNGYPVRTEVTGTIQPLSAQLAEPLSGVSEGRQDDIRPLLGGTSVSAHVTEGPWIYLYAGTLGMVTYDNKILSSAHVIATNPETGEFLDTATPVIQPGTGDGGRLDNRVGALERYIPIDFGPDAQNYADVAIASIDAGVGASPGEQFGEEGNYWIQGWTDVSKGDSIRKSGRTTGVTTGEVVHTNASVWVRYGNQFAYFVDQIVVVQENWSFIAPGDSGSAVDKDGEFVGLVFAGSDTHVAINKAQHIIAGLGIAVEPPEGWHSLFISSTPGGRVTEPGEGMFIREANTVVDLVAEADEYYRFAKWSGDVETIGDVYAAATNITMQDSYAITASFELAENWRSLFVSSTPGGAVTEPGEGMFIRGADTVVDLVAEADEYYKFVKWSGDVDTIGDVYAAATSITMQDSYAITASFELAEDWRSLSVSSTSGGAVVEPGEGMFIRGADTVVDLVAEADEYYKFVKWSGDVDTIDDVYAAATSITMHDSYSITANFETWHPEPIVLLVVLSTGGGSVTVPGEGIFSFPLGAEVGLVADAASGYQFVNWSGDVDTVVDINAASTTITMYSSYFIRANFGTATSRCFIATAAYGTPMAEEIQILRQFRDGCLLTNPAGKALVDLYYRVSPPLAEFITEHPGLKPVVRAVLAPAVAMSTVAVNTTPVEKAAVLGLFTLVAVSLVVWTTKRRDKSLWYT